MRKFHVCYVVLEYRWGDMPPARLQWHSTTAKYEKMTEKAVQDLKRSLRSVHGESSTITIVSWQELEG